MKTRTLLVAAICASLGSFANAQAFPARPVTFVVGYPAGGAVDTFARLVGKRMSDKLGQPIIVENKPGASETLAANVVAKAKPDGYSVLISTEAPITQNQFLYKSLAYNPDVDLLPVSILVKVPVALAMSTEFPADSFATFLENAKGRKVGQEVKFGSAGIGGVTHLPAAMLATKAGFGWVHVPYKGSPPLMQDLIGGRVDAAFTGFSNVLPHHISGKLKIIAVGASSRIKSIPNVPTFKDPDVSAGRHAARDRQSPGEHSQGHPAGQGFPGEEPRAARPGIDRIDSGGSGQLRHRRPAHPARTHQNFGRQAGLNGVSASHAPVRARSPWRLAGLLEP
jgi:tripartite-type tricarboxylate transporter receptor subunit TctC